MKGLPAIATPPTMAYAPFGGPERPERPSASEISPLQVIGRWKWHILGLAVLGAVIAQVVVTQLPVRYTAMVEVAIDARALQVLNVEGVLSREDLNFERLRTEMEGLRSPELAQTVVRQLDLNHNPEFCRGDSQPTLLQRAQLVYDRTLDITPSQPQGSCEVSVDQAADQLLGMITSFTDGRSYIVQISAEAGDPTLAAQIANAYGQGFVARRAEETAALGQKVSTWMTAYIAKLRTQTEAADAAVEQYRDQHNLTALRGETVTSQSLSELNTQLSLVSAQIAEKQGELSQMRNGGLGDISGSAAVLASGTVQNLVGRQAELAATVADLQSRLGSAHPKVVAAQAQLASINRQIATEIAKTQTSLVGEVAALNAKRAAITAQVNTLQGAVGAQGEAGVGLQGLVRDADAQRQLYQTMLQRLKQIEAEQGIQRPDSRVVVEAQPPRGPSYPRSRMIVVGAFLAAMALGAAIAFAVDLMSRRFRNVEQIEEETGLRVLGIFPRPSRRTSPQDIAVDDPFSVEAESLQAVLVNLASARTADIGRIGNGKIDSGKLDAGKILLVTSALPGEGKSSLAVALARSARQSGMSAILLDCDLRKPSVAKLLAGRRRGSAKPTSLPTVSADLGSSEPPIRVDVRSGLHVLPIASYVATPHQLLTSSGLPALLETLRSRYDLIVLDTPPLLAVTDALNLAPLADEVVLVVDRNSTPRDAINAAVQILRRSGIDIAGTVLSKVDVGKTGHTAYGYYAKRYGSAYHAAPAAE
jgi:succinoglycan biosynthesis transport protein ExoP